MALSKAEVKEIVKTYGLKEGDSGSPEVQIALLSKEIDSLSLHLAGHAHDFHSRRGLLMKVGKRRSLLAYLQSVSVERYTGLISKLGLRK
jgi:small subunit ribosomal protein S15